MGDVDNVYLGGHGGYGGLGGLTGYAGASLGAASGVMSPYGVGARDGDYLTRHGLVTRDGGDISIDTF